MKRHEEPMTERERKRRELAKLHTSVSGTRLSISGREKTGSRAPKPVSLPKISMPMGATND